MSGLENLVRRITDSANAAQAHYQIWFTLRGKGKALPRFYDDVNDSRYVDFFHATNAGHYKLMFIELGCLFDPDDRAASIRNLKAALVQEEEEVISSIKWRQPLLGMGNWSPAF